MLKVDRLLIGEAPLKNTPDQGATSVPEVPQINSPGPSLCSVLSSIKNPDGSLPEGKFGCFLCNRVLAALISNKADGDTSETSTLEQILDTLSDGATSACSDISFVSEPLLLKTLCPGQSV